MSFLGVGPGELLLIFILLLVVVGPERLPGLARSLGRNLVRVRNWMQTSPDAALILRARQELEQELAEIRSSLLEVQSVRDEVVGVAKQLDEAVTPITNARTSLADLIKEPVGKTQPRTTNGVDEPAEFPSIAPEDAQIAPPSLPDLSDMPASSVEPDAPAEQLISLQAPIEPELAPGGALEDFSNTMRALADDMRAFHEQARADAALKTAQIESLMSDLHALQQQLKARGLLESDWQPPSWSMYAPAQAPEPHSEEADG